MILVKANLLCNMRCDYCYQEPIRPEDQVIEWDKVESTIRDLHSKNKGIDIVLHGGEPLFQEKKNIERVLALAFELNGKSSIQTNGYLIDDDIIAMFKKYKTSVGISIDGPYPCNELRGFGDVKQRKAQTEKIIGNLFRLKNEGVSASIISVIHRANGVGDRLEMMKYWIKDLTEKGITGRLNLCCSDDDNELTVDEAITFYDEMMDFMMKNGITGWSPYTDMIGSLNKSDYVVCVFRKCDPFSTAAATSVLRDGRTGVCLRLYENDGAMYSRAQDTTDLRTKILANGDCKGCKWFENCYGGCSGMAIDRDWRRKDRWCEVYKHLFERLSNIQKFIDHKRERQQTQQEKCEPPKFKSPSGVNHSDGIEHIDGPNRHLDSNSGHNDHIVSR